MILAGGVALGADTVELARVGAWPGYERNLGWRLQAEGTTVFATDGAGLVIFDVSEPGQPRLVTRHALPGVASKFLHREFQHREGHIYAALGEAGLGIVDVRDPEAPRTLSIFAVEGGARDLEVLGNVVFVQTGVGTAGTPGVIEAVSIQDREHPTTLSRFGYGPANGLSAEGTMLCVARWEGMEIFDVTVAGEPRSVSTFLTPGYASDVFLEDGYAYVADDYRGLAVVDVRDPERPALVSSLAETSAQQVDVFDGRAYVYAPDNRVTVYDVAVPSAPVRLATLDEVRRPLTVAGNLGFCAYWGLRVYDVTDPAEAVRVGVYPLGCDPWQVAVSGQTAFVANGYLGMAILDISDPADPREVAHWLTAPGAEFVHGVSVIGRYAYLSKWYVDGVEVVDVSDPAQPVSVATLPLDPLGPMRLTATRAYVPTAWDGLVVLDITDPAQPREIGRLGDLVVPGTANIRIWHPDELAVVGDHVVVKGLGEPHVLVVDCGDAASMQVRSAVDPFLVEPYALDANQELLLVAGRPGFSIYDLADSAVPVAISHTGRNDIYTVADWDQDYIYLAGYLGTDPLTIGSDGMVVVDVRDPARPARLGSVLTEGPMSGVVAANGLIFLTYRGIGLDIFQMIPLPRLGMQRTVDGIRLTWNAMPGFTLQRSSDAAAGAWEDMGLAAGTAEIQVAIADTSVFYRLTRAR